MSKRAKAFVERWLDEYHHPDAYEDEEEHCESKANAAACFKAAAFAGIAKAEIDEEFGDLVVHIAPLRERIIDAELARLVRRCNASG